MAAVLRRARLRCDDGFSLIEMIVVISVLGILAAIAAPTYVGLQSAVKDGDVRFALASDRTALVSWGINNNGNVPSSAGFDPTARGIGLTSYGWTGSDSWTSYQYVTGTTNGQTRWCLQATSVSTAVFRVSMNQQVGAGTCAALGAANY